MTREEYLAQLRALLTGRTPPDELERILAYYTEYFDEAGLQGEGRVIRELGTPAELVGRVLGAQRSRTVPAERDCPPEGAARERHGLGTLWKVLLAICAAPIAIPLILVVVAMVFFDGQDGVRALDGPQHGGRSRAGRGVLLARNVRRTADDASDYPALCRQPFPGHDGRTVSQHLGHMEIGRASCRERV